METLNYVLAKITDYFCCCFSGQFDLPQTEDSLLVSNSNISSVLSLVAGLLAVCSVHIWCKGQLKDLHRLYT